MSGPLRFAFISILLLVPQVGIAQAPRPQPAPPAQPALDPVQAASKAAYERLDEAERKAIQNDLIWTGDFNGVAGGEYGRRTHDAMLAFERRSQGTPDGILTPAERAALKRDADAARLALRFALLTDQATGIRIGLPAAVLTQRVAVDNGVVYRRQDGAVSLQLTKLPPAQDFAELFERMRQDGPGRKVTYRLQRPDWFVVSGEEGARKFYTRLANGPDGVRGYTFRYPIDQAQTLDRIMIAIANTFEPFPGTDIAANPARVGAQPPVGQLAAPAAPALVRPSLGLTELRHAISGVSLGQGRVLTSAAALRSCESPSIAGQPLDPAGQAAGEAVILRAPQVNQPAVTLGASGAREAVFTLSFEEAAQRSVIVAAGRWQGNDNRVTSALQLGAGGAPVLDGQGRLVGLVRESPKATRMVAGTVAEASYPVIPTDSFRAALPASPPASHTQETAPRLVNQAAASLVEIRCARRI